MSNSVSNRLLAPEVYEAARRMKGNTTQEPNPGEMVSAYARAQHMSPHSIVGGSTKAPKALVDEYGRSSPRMLCGSARPPPRRRRRLRRPIGSHSRGQAPSGPYGASWGLMGPCKAL